MKMKKTSKLKQMIQSPELAFLMEAHNGLSAKIAEEAGFEGIWGSGLSISAALGVRDNNEASWTQVLEVVEFMSDATQIPILLDGDTGYGNFNNMRRLVKKLEQRGVAGVCIEDKIFPKTNSFLRGEAQPLADIEEFSGKIKAGLDARNDDDFCIVARVEALIAGWGMKEALKRAEAYRQAGATAILMHSKKNKADEIFQFMKEWDNRCPVIIVPTKYYATPTEEFRNHKISTVIWANHLMRSAVSAMQETAKTIYKEQSLINIEDKIAPVQEIFRLQNDQELEEAEKRYFQSNNDINAIILAASRGKELGELTLNKPKALLEINGTSLLKSAIDKIRGHGMNNITVVRGYKKEIFPNLGCEYIDNDLFETTGELSSLALASEKIKGQTLISYGDIAFRGHILTLLNEQTAPISIVVDARIEKRDQEYKGDFVSTSKKFSRSFEENNSRLLKTDLAVKKDVKFEIHGEWIGMLKANEEGSKFIRNALKEMKNLPNFNSLKMGDLFNYLIEKDVEIGVTYIEDQWMDVDNFKDYEKIQVF
ncbi:MAG: phosphoenolpyruvate mutase [Bdellovibrio sp.]